MQLKGLEAIDWANGWEIALLGILIVFGGLGLLVIAISWQYRCLDFFERKGKKREKRKVLQEAVSFQQPVPVLAKKEELRKSYQDYALLSKIMPEPLALPQLLEAASQRGIRRCHAAMADLLKADVLKGDGRGFYFWDQALFDTLMTGEKDRKRV